MNYAKVVVDGSPISKSNFKMHNKSGRAILPQNSGAYNDRYHVYEQHIAYQCSLQNPGIVLSDPLIAILKVFYKSELRHPDTNNITKSIFDGVEKSGLIVNDVQVKHILIFEDYDKLNPRFELELFSENHFKVDYSVSPLSLPKENKITFKTKKTSSKKINSNNKIINNDVSNNCICTFCGKVLDKSNCVTCNSGKDFICKNCLNKNM